MTFQAVIETPDYLADAKSAGLSDAERETVVLTIAANPTAGEIIPGTGGARKLRIAGRGKGKSGGYRVITYYAGSSIPVFLLNVFSKGDKVNLSMAERNEVRTMLQGLARAYGRGGKPNVESR